MEKNLSPHLPSQETDKENISSDKNKVPTL